MYRPQFSFPLPKCDSQRFHYAYDQSNLPTLTSTLAPGAHTGRIPLQMDRDAAFLIRAIQQFASAYVQVRLESAYVNALSDSGNALEQSNYVYPALYSECDGAGLVAIDSDDWGIYCPRGGVLNLYLNNPTAGTVNLSGIKLTLHGIKLYEDKPCR